MLIINEWRLPFVEEFEQLFGKKRIYGKNELHPGWQEIQNFFNSLEKTFWTSSHYSSFIKGAAWYASLEKGITYEGSADYDRGFVRLVRQGKSERYFNNITADNRFKLSDCKTYVIDEITGLEWKRDAELERCSWRSAILKFSEGAIKDSRDSEFEQRKNNWRLPHKIEFLRVMRYEEELGFLLDDITGMFWSSDDGASRMMPSVKPVLFSTNITPRPEALRVRLVRNAVRRDKSDSLISQFEISACGDFVTDYVNKIEWERNSEPGFFTYDEAKKRFKVPSFEETLRSYTFYSKSDSYRD